MWSGSKLDMTLGGVALRGMGRNRSEDLQLPYSFPVWSALWASRECLLSLWVKITKSG